MQWLISKSRIRGEKNPCSVCVWAIPGMAVYGLFTHAPVSLGSQHLAAQSQGASGDSEMRRNSEETCWISCLPCSLLISWELGSLFPSWILETFWVKLAWEEIIFSDSDQRKHTQSEGTDLCCKLFKLCLNTKNFSEYWFHVLKAGKTLLHPKCGQEWRC